VFNSNNFCTFTISGAAYTLPASGCRSSSSGTLDSVGDFGYYWSGSAADSGNAYELNFDSGNAYADDDTLRNFGQPVRCVLQE
jgi:hypothetical protein